MAFKNFNEYYSYHLKEHSNLTCRRFHFFATSGVISLLLLVFFTGDVALLLMVPIVAYVLPWMGHLAFEKNKSEIRFRHPIYRMLGDFKMFWEIIAGKVKAF